MGDSLPKLQSKIFGTTLHIRRIKTGEGRKQMKAGEVLSPRRTFASKTFQRRIRSATTQVLVKPLTCGICGTDLHEFAGGPIVTPASPHKFTGAVLPQILGHEFSAEVLNTGHNVEAGPQRRSNFNPATRHAARRLLQPTRSQPSETQHGLHQAELGLGRDGRTGRNQRLQRQRPYPQRHRRAGGAR